MSRWKTDAGLVTDDERYVSPYLRLRLRGQEEVLRVRARHTGLPEASASGSDGEADQQETTDAETT